MSEIKKSSGLSGSLNPFSTPQILLFDVDDGIKNRLEEDRFSLSVGTFGACIGLNYSGARERYFIKNNADLPKNTHEFDVIFIDMTRESVVAYHKDMESLGAGRGNKAYSFLCEYPRRIFDPRPLSVQLLREEFGRVLDKGGVIVAFCDREIKEDYNLIETNSRGSQSVSNSELSSLNFYPGFPGSEAKSGKLMMVPPKSSLLSQLLIKHLSGAEYGAIFHHPGGYRGGKFTLSEDFIPLLINGDDEIVAFCHCIGKGAFFLFPSLCQKEELISHLCNVNFPEIFPSLFPSHGEFGWLSNGEYLLPNEKQLLEKRDEIKNRYEEETRLVNEEIKINAEKHKFLQDMISQSGHELVDAVEAYMKWVGFPQVKNMDDEASEVLEEDLQIEADRGLLVIEVKGVGGTSTDKDCAQISKIRYRRAEQRGKFDVSGLYIVNHQRYMPPRARQNPPFSKNQINDARLEKRGLLTTFELYKAYFMVEDGLLDKGEIRDQLFNVGLIDLFPKKLISLGAPSEVLRNGLVAILDISEGVTLRAGCQLIAKCGDELKKVQVLSIRINDVQVDFVESGEVGIGLSAPIKKGTELFIRE